MGDRLAGKDASTDRVRWGAVALADPPTATPNAGAWTAGLDLTAVSVANDAAGAVYGNRGLTLITPLHCVTATHFGWPDGSKVWYRGSDGTVYGRTAVTAGDVGDVRVLRLSSALPAAVTPLPLMPAPGSHGWPAAGFLCGRYDPFTDSGRWDVMRCVPSGASLVWANDATTLAGWGFSGDADAHSGSPVVGVLGDVPVLLSHLFGSGSGPDYSQRLAAIRAVTRADGHDVATVDLSGYS